MAPKPKSIVAKLTNPQEKGKVTRFDATDESQALTSAYVDKAALKKAFGTVTPDNITVTITV